MDDIVERLRGFKSAAAQSWAHEAADEIESLRQRVKELDEENKQLCYKSIMQLNELAALKAGQGEPYAYGMSKENAAKYPAMYQFSKHSAGGVWDIPLYTAPTIPEGLVMVPVSALNGQLYSLLTDIQNGVDSPATCSMANQELRKIDKLLAAAPKPEE